jgi:hypothetical protein
MSCPPHAKGICDRCGFERKLSALRKEWTGLKVCSDCFEKRHPQDFVRGVPDFQALHDPRPEPEPVFIGPGDVAPEDL